MKRLLSTSYGNRTPGTCLELTPWIVLVILLQKKKISKLKITQDICKELPHIATTILSGHTPSAILP